jgi:hypothetical protein
MVIRILESDLCPLCGLPLTREETLITERIRSLFLSWEINKSKLKNLKTTNDKFISCKNRVDELEKEIIHIVRNGFPIITISCSRCGYTRI